MFCLSKPLQISMIYLLPNSQYSGHASTISSVCFNLGQPEAAHISFLATSLSYFRHQIMLGQCSLNRNLIIKIKVDRTIGYFQIHLAALYIAQLLISSCLLSALISKALGLLALFAVRSQVSLTQSWDWVARIALIGSSQLFTVGSPCNRTPCTIIGSTGTNISDNCSIMLDRTQNIAARTCYMRYSVESFIFSMISTYDLVIGHLQGKTPMSNVKQPSFG